MFFLDDSLLDDVFVLFLKPLTIHFDLSQLFLKNSFGIKRAITQNKTKYNHRYKVKEVLGKGTFGVVRRCVSRQPPYKELAVKTILKSKIPNVELLKREIQILKDVDHPHIIKLYDVYEDSKSIHLVTELCTGGELYDRIIAKTHSPEGHYSEYDAGRIIRNVLEAISYCHNVKNIVHRDLKPENFLLLNKNDDSPVKIIDFGLSRQTDVEGGGIMQTRVGTVYYVAPEVFTSKDHYTCKCDIWSIGVITYVLLCGYPPFLGQSDAATLDLVKNAIVDFPPEGTWDDITDEAKEFIQYLLNPNPELRPTADEALQHSWLNHPSIEPNGVCRRASFACDTHRYHRHSFNDTITPTKQEKEGETEETTTITTSTKTKAKSAPPIKLKINCSTTHNTKRRTMFQKLLTAAKLKKRISNHHDHDDHHHHGNEEDDDDEEVPHDP